MINASKYAFVFNPSANRQKAAVSLSWLEQQVNQYWPESDVMVSGSPADAIQIAKEAANEYDAIIACGGDGTIQIVASALKKQKTSLGIIPFGTGNDFIKSAGISPDTKTALQQLSTAIVKPVDILEYSIDGKTGVAINTIGIGFDAQINFQSKSFKRLQGKLVYPAAVAKSLSKIKTSDFLLDIDGEQIDEKLIMLTLANGTTEGGNFKIVPHADISDGEMDIAAIKPMNIAGLLYRLGLLKLERHQGSDKIQFHKASKVNIQTSNPLFVHADGEHISSAATKIQVHVLKHAIRLLVPG